MRRVPGPTAPDAGRPRLRIVDAPDDAEGVVLLLHGGRERSWARVRANQLAPLRMVPIAGRIRRVGAGRLIVLRLQYRVRGWNEPQLPAVADAHWALEQIRTRFPGLPIALVGHSLGGRTAMRVADDAGVRSVVGLAPWLPPDEPVPDVAGRSVLIIHGSADHTTDPRSAEAYASAQRDHGAHSSFVLVPGVRHGMLHRRGLIEGLTAAFVAATLLGTETEHAPYGQTTSRQSGSNAVANLLYEVRSGTDRLVV